jgi:FixJ family two-component response regulator
MAPPLAPDCTLWSRFALFYETPREREVMAFVTAGLMNKQIAAEMGVSEITVKIHRGHTMKNWARGRLPTW